jgi:GNAT superfamily N-acetyltransferase
VTGIRVRDATSGDLEPIAKVAIAAGQDEEWSGSDPAYVSHLLAHGRLVVAEHRGAVAGFGATRQIGAGPAAVTMLSDLFVDPRCHGLGLGQTMLAVLWSGSSPRMTFSSLHAHALPLYARSGLDAWWPLLYLSGDVTALPAPAVWAVTPAAPDEAATLEQRWTGIDRTADHRAWAGRPAGQVLIARLGGQALATGTVAGAGAEYGVVHLALAPAAGDAEARDAFSPCWHGLVPPGSPGAPGSPGWQARVCLPARPAPGDPAAARGGLGQRMLRPVHGHRPWPARPAPRRPLPALRLTRRPARDKPLLASRQDQPRGSALISASNARTRRSISSRITRTVSTGWPAGSSSTQSRYFLPG